jgi:YedE family putative selenium metabolism protein
MESIKNVFAGRWGIIGAGILIGVLAPLLQKWGNPPNMGVCGACFERDIAGAIGLHRAEVVQYLRPEIIGFVLGSLIAAYLFREFRPRLGSAPIVRFALGAFAMIGALVFLGVPGARPCAWPAATATRSLAGGLASYLVRHLFLKEAIIWARPKDPHLRRAGSSPVRSAVALMLFFPLVAARGRAGSCLKRQGAGSMHAPLAVSLVVGLVIGFFAQRTRFCTMGAIRDFVLFRQMHLLSGFIALIVTAWVVNLILGQFKPGFEGQPISHTMHLWNFTGMVLAGLAFCLAGGCPGRQLFLAGEGDGDAAVFVVGMIVGAAIAHNFGLASSATGVGPYGIPAVVIGLVFCLFVGFAMREKNA